MKNRQRIYLPVLLFLNSVCITAQTVEKIRFGKNPSLIYFFQKGSPADTIVKNKTDLFYLLVPDSLKPHISIFIENGRLLTTSNDSLVKFDFLKGLNYESTWSLAESVNQPPRPSKTRRYVLKSAINGAAPAGWGNKIVIRVLNRLDEKILIENVFYYKDPLPGKKEK